MSQTPNYPPPGSTPPPPGGGPPYPPPQGPGPQGLPGQPQYAAYPQQVWYPSGVKPHRGSAVLVLGILSLVMPCTLVLGIIAWVMGTNDLREMNQGLMDPAGRGLTNAGRICGIIGVCWIGAIVLFWLATILFGFTIAGAAAHMHPRFHGI